MTAMAPVGPPPPPSVGSRQAWPPPPDLSASAAGPAAEDDPWASWYDKPRTRQLDTPSATMPRVPPSAGSQYDAPGYAQPDGATQQYPGGQQYPGAMPYPGTQQWAGSQGAVGGENYDAAPAGGQYGAPQQHGPYAGTQQPPGPQYASPQYGDPQYGGLPYPDPQHGGPPAGPQYGDPQYGNPQFPDPQYGGPQYAGPPARGASRLAALRSRGPLVPIAAVGAVALVVIVAVVIATSSHGGTPTPTASQGTQGPGQASSSASADAAQQAAATKLSGMLKQSGAHHADVNAAVGDVESCQRLRTARSAFGASAGNRENLLSELRTLPGRAALPAPLLADLTGAWKASVQVDNDLHDWAQDEINRGCNPKKVQNDPAYQKSLGPDGTATADKQEFAKAWAPIARKYGLPAYQWSQI